LTLSTTISQSVPASLSAARRRGRAGGRAYARGSRRRWPLTAGSQERVRKVLREIGGVGVVVLSKYVEEDYAFDLLAEGVAGMGYLLKECVSDLDELVRALHEVARAGSELDPLVVEALLARRASALTSTSRAGSSLPASRSGPSPRNSARARDTPSGATRSTARCRPVTTPAARSRWYARATVPVAQPRSPATTRTGPNASPGAYRPASTSAANASATSSTVCMSTEEYRRKNGAQEATRVP